MSRISLLITLFLWFLVACGPATSAAPNPQVMQGQVETMVAQTLAAQQALQDAIATAVAQTLTAQPTATPLPPTSTPMPTQPFLPPTLTPIILPTFTPIPSGGGGGGYSTPSPYSCAVLNKTPADNTVFKPNKDFDVKFWLKNTGTRKWDAGTDLAFSSGTNMLVPPTTRLELGSDVNPGSTAGPFIFDAKSPNKEGTYVMILKLQGGFCYPYIRIVVRP